MDDRKLRSQLRNVSGLELQVLGRANTAANSAFVPLAWSATRREALTAGTSVFSRPGLAQEPCLMLNHCLHFHARASAS